MKGKMKETQKLGNYKNWVMGEAGMAGPEPWQALLYTSVSHFFFALPCIVDICELASNENTQALICSKNQAPVIFPVCISLSLSSALPSCLCGSLTLTN